MYFALFCVTAAVCLIFYKGARIVRPAQRGLVESFGRYKRFAKPGFHWVIPIIRKLYIVSVAEQMLDIGPQLVITSDNVNAVADAQIYLRVRADEAGVRSALYDTDHYELQVRQLAGSALKDIIGTIPLHQLSGERERICAALRAMLEAVSGTWGVEITRAVLGDIELPKDVQETMCSVIKAENEKKAAADFALAAERAADGIKHADIKKAEGKKQARILEAEGEAKAIRVICDAAQQYFTGSAQLLRVLEASEAALKNTVSADISASSGIIKALGDKKPAPEERILPEQRISQQV